MRTFKFRQEASIYYFIVCLDMSKTYIETCFIVREAFKNIKSKHFVQLIGLQYYENEPKVNNFDFYVTKMSLKWIDWDWVQTSK